VARPRRTCLRLVRRYLLLGSGARNGIRVQNRGVLTWVLQRCGLTSVGGAGAGPGWYILTQPWVAIHGKVGSNPLLGGQTRDRTYLARSSKPRGRHRRIVAVLAIISAALLVSGSSGHAYASVSPSSSPSSSPIPTASPSPSASPWSHLPRWRRVRPSFPRHGLQRPRRRRGSSNSPPPTDGHHDRRLQRRQASVGFSSASIVYQAMIDESSDRYMMVFQEGTASDIGPIRSARPYYVPGRPSTRPCSVTMRRCPGSTGDDSRHGQGHLQPGRPQRRQLPLPPHRYRVVRTTPTPIRPISSVALPREATRRLPGPANADLRRRHAGLTEARFPDGRDPYLARRSATRTTRLRLVFAIGRRHAADRPRNKSRCRSQHRVMFQPMRSSLRSTR